MRRILAGLLALGWFVPWLAPVASIADAQWGEFRAPNSGFAILMPGQTWTYAQTTAKGNIITTYFAELGSTQWVVADYIAPQSEARLLAESDKILDVMRDGGVARTHCTLRTQRKFLFGDAPAIDVACDIVAKNQTIAERICIFHQHLFQVTYSGPLNSETGPDVKQFFDSFHFIEK